MPEATKDYLQLVLTLASFIGAISFAFTDTFWFSAVEGEVYATSSLFTAAVFWSILKWEEDKSEFADRWLFLIFFVLGLSVGVHLLNLLALPAVALVFYFKRYMKLILSGIIISLVVSFILMVIIIFGFIPGVVALNCPYRSLICKFLDYLFILVLYFCINCLLGGVIYGVHHYRKKAKKLAHFIILAFGLWLAGYSTFTSYY
jgi:hypothetical protein